MLKSRFLLISMLVTSQIAAFDFNKVFSSLEKMKQSWFAAQERQTVKSNRLFNEGEQQLKKILKAGQSIKASTECKFAKTNDLCFKSICNDPDKEHLIVGFCIDTAQSDSKVESFQALPLGAEFTGEATIANVEIEGGGRATYLVTSPETSSARFDKGLYTIAIFVKLKKIMTP